jgi:hypothetical protein
MIGMARECVSLLTHASRGSGRVVPQPLCVALAQFALPERPALGRVVKSLRPPGPRQITDRVDPVVVQDSRARLDAFYRSQRYSDSLLPAFRVPANGTMIMAFEQCARFDFAAAMLPAKMLDNPGFRPYPAERTSSYLHLSPPRSRIGELRVSFASLARPGSASKRRKWSSRTGISGSRKREMGTNRGRSVRSALTLRRSKCLIGAEMSPVLIEEPERCRPGAKDATLT